MHNPFRIDQPNYNSCRVAVEIEGSDSERLY